ncbi:peptidylprolyl isomerase [Arsenicitalea aurantiaca]|uniref:Peptidyl-prolyl cis-trans isomerase n=2 Tax=Arsenicitalea aurantiaca TaxID=1783274 RepID=A0A433XH03_9HYPH|nr:peptidylprolyl isomerase [Arsenicitalea aurantiaca]
MLFKTTARRLAGTLALASVLALGSTAGFAQDGTPHLLLELEDGTVEIALQPELAPNHVERIVALAEQGFYDGVVFHRVITDFMAQTGDPTGTGMGGSDLPDLTAEFTSTPFVRGTLGMARSANPNSANSQFFIVYADAPHLNGQYTVFGNVVSGMDYVDALEQGDPRNNGAVANPDSIVSATIEYR